MRYRKQAQQWLVRAVSLLCGFAVVATHLPVALAGPVTVILKEQRLTLSTVVIQGEEYLSLANLAKAVGRPANQVVTRERVRIPLGRSVLSLTVGSPEVRVGTRVVSLSKPPRRLGRAIVVPIELVPITLGAQYGETRVSWDQETLTATIVERDHTLRVLRFHTYPDHTRVVLEGTRPHDFIVLDDGASGRVVVEVKQGILSPLIRSRHVSDGLVRTIETQQLGNASQITIYGMGRSLSSTIFALQRPDRIVVDLFSRDRQARSSRQAEAAIQPTPGQTVGSKAAVRSDEPIAPSGVSSPEHIIKTVVIDPGHGGRDSGAIGQSGAKEKDIVLDIGLRLQELIEETLGMRVIMTRTEDIFVPLEDRTMIANRHKADFFISLHVNAAPQSRAVGFETYFLSREPSDRGAKASAIRENTALHLDGVGRDAQRGLKTILWDMTHTFYVKESSELAESLLNELGRHFKVENRGVKSAPFYVLVGAAMPSVLVELAFITNPDEEQKFEQESYRHQVAQALLAGIAKFKTRYEKRVGWVPAPSSAMR